jgi:hypothetical protein
LYVLVDLCLMELGFSGMRFGEYASRLGCALNLSLSNLPEYTYGAANDSILWHDGQVRSRESRETRFMLTNSVHPPRDERRIVGTQGEPAARVRVATGGPAASGWRVMRNQPQFGFAKKPQLRGVKADAN